MPVYRTARFDVRPEAVEECLAAIRELVESVRSNEPGTRLYVSLQDKVHPPRFTHFMIFEDEAADQRHQGAEATRRFMERLTPLVVGGVQVKDFKAVAST
jgi:quinol monooxygenase YgiN